MPGVLYGFEGLDLLCSGGLSVILSSVVNTIDVSVYAPKILPLSDSFLVKIVSILFGAI